MMQFPWSGQLTLENRDQILELIPHIAMGRALVFVETKNDWLEPIIRTDVYLTRPAEVWTEGAKSGILVYTSKDLREYPTDGSVWVELQPDRFSYLFTVEGVHILHTFQVQ